MSRFDDVGLFWQDVKKERGVITRPMPPIPDTGWLPPTKYPDLRNDDYIAIDLETYDPDLLDFGPGWARGVGHIVGVSIMGSNGFKGYYPMRHETEEDWNFEPQHVLDWLQWVLSNPNQPKIGANLTYDAGWLRQEGVTVEGKLYDVQVAEALLNEYARVNLEELGQKYLGLGKESDDLYQWLSDWKGGKANGKQRKWIYLTPPRLTGYYAESDVYVPMEVFKVQRDLLWQEGLWDLFEMETDLIKLMIDMRFAGVSVDIPATEKLKAEFSESIEEQKKALEKETGIPLNINNKDGSLIDYWNHYAIPIVNTPPSEKYPEGQPSFAKDVLESISHPIAESVIDIRKKEKFVSTFLQGYLLDSHVNGKVYGQFKPLLGETGGTRSGRFSSSNPNLQNIPSRDKVWAPRIRGLFIPDEGHVRWRKYDYSQIEYRFFAHYAIGAGADEIRDKYANDARTDYHSTVINLIYETTGLEVPRSHAKGINFGLLYGMGKPKLAKMLGVSTAEADILFSAYHQGVPYAKTTMDAVKGDAVMYGMVTTILDRRARFDMWEQKGYNPKKPPPQPYEKAYQWWGSKIQRAGLHKSINRKLQGSAADMMKLAMVECYNSGVFDATGIPRLTVHDELDFSDDGSLIAHEAFKEMKHIMETCMKLKVPVIVDEEWGSNWGNVTEVCSI